MIVRRSPAIVLSLALGAAALSVAPALAKDGGATKDGPRRCSNEAIVKVNTKRVEGNNYRVQVVAAVFSDDSDVWEWKFRRNGELVYDGRARGREDSDLAFRVSRSMIDFSGPDDIVFRAENLRTGEVCRITDSY